jgi:regulator of sigma E protease
VFLSIIGFICILGPLVVVHEFGHYIFARIFGVKAEVFSVGFGPKLWSRQRGETEWCVSAIPLGGYVRLLGEESGQELPPELASRSLQKQARWKRFFIFFGGPLFNFIFAALLFMAIQVIGEEHVTSRIGRVLPGSVAAQSGLKSGDKIIEIGGIRITKFDDIETQLLDHPSKAIELKVERFGTAEPLVLTIQTGSEAGYSAFGEKTQVGHLPGVFPAAREPVVGISNPNSPAAKVGVKTGDRIQSWNGAPIQNYEQVEELFAVTQPGQAVELKILSGKKDVLTLGFVRSKDAQSLGDETGIYSSELFVEKVVDESPAATIGLIKGDRVIAIDGVAISSFFGLRDQVQKGGETAGKLRISWERNGELIEKEAVPSETVSRDPDLGKVRQFTVGIYPMLSWAQPEVLIERTFNPFVVAYEGVSKMIRLSWRNLISLAKMFVGDVSVKTLGGPILIGKIAGESMARGLITFLGTMAILSIGLGVLNILPIPVLDGGHIMLLGVEAIRGKPLQMRQLEIVQQVGLALVLLLMVIVMRNDFARLF